MSFDVMFNHAVKLHEDGQIDDAELIYRELLETSPKNPDLLHLLGLIAHQKQSLASAVDLLGYAAALKPDHTPYVFSLALALQDWGKHFEALENYRKVIELEPNIPETWNNMGNIYRLEKETTNAKECFNKALEINPEFVTALNNLALVFFDLGEIEKAKEYLQKTINLEPKYDEALFNLANIERDYGNIEKAIKLYQKALTSNPNFVRCFNSMGVALEKTKKLSEAEEAFKQALKINPKYADAIKNLANICLLTGRENEAEEYYKSSLKIDKNLFDSHVNLGNLLQKQNRLEEALEHYRKAIIINPKQPEICNNLALAVQASGDIEEAVGLLCNSLYLKPDLTQTKYNLVSALYDMYNNFDQEMAIKIAENWVRTFKQDPVAKHCLDSLKKHTNKDGASLEYISEFFDEFSLDFEKTLQQLKYETPQIIKEILPDILPQKNNLKVLDIGCGTGLCGIFLKDYAKELIGVDLSKKMLKRAKEKKLYTILENKNISDYLSCNFEFDLMISADVFCYFAELKSILINIRKSLNENGILIFSVEENFDKNNYQIYPNGRYKHSKEYIEEIIKQTKFKLIELQQKQIRLEKDEPVLGIIAVIKKS